MMIENAALILIGFSVCASTLLAVTRLSVYRHFAQDGLSYASGFVLLLGLVCIQWQHANYLLHGGDLYRSKLYAVLLFVVAPAFLLFFAGALRPGASFGPLRMLYYAPVVAAIWIPNSIAIPLAFVLGTLYALRLVVMVQHLRAQRRHFRLERFVFAGFAVISLTILALGLVAPLYSAHAFFTAYASMIGLSFLLVIYTLLRFPDLVEKTAEIVVNASAVSTLTRIDRDRVLDRLTQVMEVEKAYSDETLNLARLAESVDLAPHQLSELINTHFGISFPRYLRGHRIEAAKRMLLDEPNASVLSVGLAVGFTSQSNFYAAFRDNTGQVPGQFRKLGGNGATPHD